MNGNCVGGGLLVMSDLSRHVSILDNTKKGCDVLHELHQ